MMGLSSATGARIGAALLAWLLCASPIVPGAGQTAAEAPVRAEDYSAFWLWVGVRPQPVLKGAQTVYLHYGEIHRADRGRLVRLRPGDPRVRGVNLWLVVRADTLDWAPETLPRLIAAVARWRQAGLTVQGLQIDFDSPTRALDHYVRFLGAVRSTLPPTMRLSITGLMDWGAGGDPAALQQLAGTVDEVVIQTYRGRRTIPGYELYLARLSRLRMPFRIGLVQGGLWRAPPGLEGNRWFRGYVVFLVNPHGRTDRPEPWVGEGMRGE